MFFKPFMFKQRLCFLEKIVSKHHKWHQENIELLKDPARCVSALEKNTKAILEERLNRDTEQNTSHLETATKLSELRRLLVYGGDLSTQSEWQEFAISLAATLFTEGQNVQCRVFFKRCGLADKTPKKK